MEEHHDVTDTKNPKDTRNERRIKATTANNCLPTSGIAKDITRVLINSALNTDA